ncbi:hypothetical protein [Pelomonas caseinilytica]|nr:hypothetical protein [Pelomonas sp. P7]
MPKLPGARASGAAAPLAGSGIEPGGGGATQPPSGSAASGPR